MNELTKFQSLYRVQLEIGVWICDVEGDPGRTCDRSKAQTWNEEKDALKALEAAREFRPFEFAKIDCPRFGSK